MMTDMHNDAIPTLVMSGKANMATRNRVGNTDLPRLKEGGVGLQVFVLFCDGSYGPGNAFQYANQMADALDRMVRKHPDKIQYATTVADAVHLKAEGKIAALMAVEGGHMIENRMDYLEQLAGRGAKYLTLTWNNSTEWATSAADEMRGSRNFCGLTAFGRQVINKMNALGMMIDLSHAGEQTFYDTLRVTEKPVLVTHSNCYTLAPHYRNLKDDQIRAIGDNGGVIGINFYSGFVDSGYQDRLEKLLVKYQSRFDQLVKESSSNRMYAVRELLNELPPEEVLTIRPPLARLIDHIDHIVALVGIEHVGIGSDFDGAESYVRELDDVAAFPRLKGGLLARGYHERDIENIFNANFERVWKAHELNSM
ncbi:dipeptidase [Parapedobacter tibetensis]|uniref:dipeptidase n=1 Tax=Parapedobacter tibetensis TaxID=2972951 RepID=UPI00214DDE51|nr:dipeptidase [Parapedobacter tibetensis]